LADVRESLIGGSVVGKIVDEAKREEQRIEARVKGYVGEACPECGDFYLMRSGTGLRCDRCGWTSDTSSEGKMPTADVQLPTAEDIKRTFLAAMRAGYASDAPKKTTIVELPGSKVITFEDGPWVVKDVYFVSPGSTFSSGMTIIYYNCHVVWTMQYQGSYPENIIPFLKRALAANYNKNEWCGGRGPAHYGEGELVYLNTRAYNFEKFEGREEISRSPGGQLLGFHTYQGIMWGF